MTEVSRERHVEIRWEGDEKTEAALLRAIDLKGMPDPAPGYYERWMSIPERKRDAALQALKKTGAHLLKPKLDAGP